MEHFWIYQYLILSTLDFKLAKLPFLGKDGVSILAAFFRCVFVAKLDKSNLIFTFPKDFRSGKYSLIYTMFFLVNPFVKRTIVAFPFNV